MKKIITFLEDYKVIFSIISLLVLIGIAEFISYIRESAYYSYFNIPQSLIKTGGNGNLFSTIVTLFILIFFIAEIYIFYYFIVLFYNNRKNFKEKYSFPKRITIIAATLILAILGFALVNSTFVFYFTKEFKYDLLLATFCFLLSILAISIKISIIYMKNLFEESREVVDKRWDFALIILLLAAFCVLMINQINESGLENAKNKKEFLINNNVDKVILYNDNNILIMADYEINKENNSIII